MAQLHGLLETISTEGMNRFFSDASTGRFVCASVLQLLDLHSNVAIAKTYVLKMLFISTPVSASVIKGSVYCILPSRLYLFISPLIPTLDAF